MISDALLNHGIRGNKIVPNFLGPEDTPWLQTLIDEFIRFDGHPRRDLLNRLTEPFPFVATPAKLGLASATLKQILIGKRTSAKGLNPKILRATLFKAGHAMKNRNSALDHIASEFKTQPNDLLSMLFRDLGSERLLDATEIQNLSTIDLALRSNLALAKGYLSRARSVTLNLHGQCRPVIRQAKLRRLICLVEKNQEEGFQLSISGPFSLFRHTLVYSRYLGELLPFLQNCGKFEMDAICILRGHEKRLRLESGLPIPPASLSKKYDSQLEQRFARDFLKAAADWDLIREPEPIIVGNRWFFPDFEIRNRRSHDKRWHLEIVGYWNPEYLTKKLETLRVAKLTNFIVCIDQKNACGQYDWRTTEAHIIEYSKKINPNAILSHLQSSK